MERAQLSTADGKERKPLIAAREQLHLSQEEVAERLGVSKATVHRWEKKGDIPQPYHLRELCKLFEASARELGFDEKYAVDGLHIDHVEEEIEEDVLVAFRKQNNTSRLMSIVWNWSKRDTRYQMLQVAILMELEDNSMDDEISRRDALRFLALVPVDMLGLSQVGAAFKGSHEDVLTYCAAGVTACWYLRKGKDLLFANQTVSKYIPTLKAVVQSAPAIQRKAAAALLSQCFLLKAPLAWNLTTTSDAIHYARQAEAFGVIAGSRLLQITALRTTAAALCYANQWEQALQAAEKAKYLLEQKEQSTPLQPAEEPIPQLVSSYVYAGLATYRAYDGRKEDAFHVLKKAHTTFFERSTDEKVPPWVDHNIGNLLINDGETRLHLGLYKEAISSLEGINTQYAQDTTISLTGRINSLLNQVIAEVSRDDQPRDMEWCINRWKQGIEGAKTVQSQRHFNEAIQAYTAMRVAWPGEMRIKDLRDHIVHW